MRNLLLFVLVLIVIFYVRRWFQRSEKSGTPAQIPPQESSAERMCECCVCGVLVPESEAVRVRDAHYCSLEHARSDKAGGQV